MSPQTTVQSPSSVSASNAGFSVDAFDQSVMKTYGRFPIALDRGAGCRVWDTEGREYLDFVAGIATCTLGHAHPVMIDTVTKQMQTLHHVSNLYYIPSQGDLAQWLTEHSCADRVFFCNSGAEANESAIKLARKYAHTVQGIDDPIIITANASFHGRTLATITATGQPKYQKNFNPLVPGFHYVPYNDIAALEEAIATLNQETKRVGAILLEPLQGEGGVNPGDRAYFQRIRDICTEQNILLIFDEVQVGMGRSGHYWGHEVLGVEPDVFTSAKGLGGGVPIGAMLCKEDVAVLAPGDHASTYGGNPFVCAVALAVCQTLERENILENVRDRGDQLRKGVQSLIDAYPTIFSHVRGWGLINGLVLNPDNDLKSIDIVKAAMENGLLVVPAGPNVVRLVPPLIVTAAEVDEAIALMRKTLEQLVG